MPSISEKLALLEQAERRDIKMRAKAVRDAIFDQLPYLCIQPCVSVVDGVCCTAVFNARDHQQQSEDRVLDGVSGMFLDYAAHCDMAAAGTLDPVALAGLRRGEDAYRRIARIVEDIKETGFRHPPAPQAL